MGKLNWFNPLCLHLPLTHRCMYSVAWKSGRRLLSTTCGGGRNSNGTGLYPWRHSSSSRWLPSTPHAATTNTTATTCSGAMLLATSLLTLLRDEKGYSVVKGIERCSILCCYDLIYTHTHTHKVLDKKSLENTMIRHLNIHPSYKFSNLKSFAFSGRWK